MPKSAILAGLVLLGASLPCIAADSPGTKPATKKPPAKAPAAPAEPAKFEVTPTPAPAAPAPPASTPAITVRPTVAPPAAGATTPAATPAAAPAAPAGPPGEIEVPEPVHDAGQVERGGPLTHAFLIKNVGKGELTIQAKPG